MQQNTINSKVKAEFFFCADKLDFNIVNCLMGITATRIRTSESFRIKEFAKDYWCLSTEYEASEDISIQLNKIFVTISTKKNAIKNICEQYDSSCAFLVVVEYNDIFPTVHIGRDFVKFAAEIDAEIGITFN